MKIGIIEISSGGHSQAVRTISKIFKKNEIFAFVSEEIEKNIKDLRKDSVKIFVKKNSEKSYKFLKKIEKLKLDFIFIITMQTDFLGFLLFNPKKTGAKTFVNFRNAQKWIRKLPESLEIKEMIRHMIRQIWKRRMSGATVGIQNQKTFLTKKGFKKQIGIIPFSLYEKHRDLSKNNKILKIIIPGIVSEIRRENLKFLEAFEKIPKDMKKKISINFLGPPGKTKEDKYKEILKKVLIMKKKGFDLTLHDKFIPLQEYNKQLNDGDIIFGPIKIKINNEVYNVSKDTGIHFNMISGAKPGLLPEELAKIKELESSTICFKNYSEAFQILIDLSKNRKKLNKLKDDAAKNSLNFTPEKVKESMDIFLLKQQ